MGVPIQCRGILLDRLLCRFSVIKTMPIDPLCAFLNPPPPRIPPAPFRIDPRIGTPDEIKVGDRVCLRGGGRGGNPLATRGTVTSVEGNGFAEMIGIRTNLNQSVLYFFWDVAREDYRTPAIQRIRKSSLGTRLIERAYTPPDGPMYKKVAAEVAKRNEFKPKTEGGRTRRRKRRSKTSRRA